MGQVGVGIDGALWVSILVLWQILCAGLVLFVRFVVVRSKAGIVIKPEIIDFCFAQ